MKAPPRNLIIALGFEVGGGITRQESKFVYNLLLILTLVFLPTYISEAIFVVFATILVDKDLYWRHLLNEEPFGCWCLKPSNIDRYLVLFEESVNLKFEAKMEEVAISIVN